MVRYQLGDLTDPQIARYQRGLLVGRISGVGIGHVRKVQAGSSSLLGLRTRARYETRGRMLSSASIV